MIVKNLSDTSIDTIMKCFLKAFDNYYVKMPTDYSFYKERWNAAKVDFRFSYGMFHNEELVGFVIHAIDKRFGILNAFNSGTGVIPKFRGKRIVKSIYDFALNDLKENGIEKVALDVITDNQFAIQSYRSIGFKTCKNFLCYKGSINSNNSKKIKLTQIDKQNFSWENLPNQQYYSWDNQKESLMNGNYTK